MTEYKIWVKAFTWKNEGEPSDHIMQKTDVAGPSAPLILNLTCQAQDAIYIYWSRPDVFWNSIDYYYIKYRNDLVQKYTEIEIPTFKEHLNSGVIITSSLLNLTFLLLSIVDYAENQYKIDYEICNNEALSKATSNWRMCVTKLGSRSC